MHLWADRRYHDGLMSMLPVNAQNFILRKTTDRQDFLYDENEGVIGSMSS